MYKNISKIVAVFAIAAILMPTLASAHGMDSRNDGSFGARFGSWVTNEFGVKTFDANANVNTNTNANVNKDKDNDNDNRTRESHDQGQNKDRGFHFGELRDHGFIANLFYNGTVTATSNTGFTVKTKDGSTFTVTTGSAKIVSLPHTVIALADINVGDAVHITGTKNGTNGIDASVVYVLPANLKPAVASGTVTAVNTSTGAVTLQTKDDGTSITVNTDSNTHFADNNSNTNNNDLTSSDVQVGMKAKVVGFWDSVLNVFNAIKVKLF